MEKKNWAIVDDDQVFQLTTQVHFNKINSDGELYFFKNGKELIDHLEENKSDVEQLPDVILLDLKMPIMNGWDFIERFLPLREEFAKDINLYILTSSIDQKDKERAKKISAVRKYIEKPIGTSKIEQIIDDLQAA